MDRKVALFRPQYRVKYFARKHGLSAADARSILQRAGQSREKANELAAAEKSGR